MWVRHWRRFVLAATSCVLLFAAAPAAQSRGNAYDRGYREGLPQGTQDARQGREARLDRNSTYRDADRGYQNRFGSRDVYRDNFRRGFAAGYRTGFD